MNVLRRTLLACALAAPVAFGVALAAESGDGAGFLWADAPWRFEFPRDHASHPAFRTEWWYYTGHLASNARHFGYQLTLFRVGLDRGRRAGESAWAPHTMMFAHLALTDEASQRFTFAERTSRVALDLAGADSTRERVWIGDWSAWLDADGTTQRLSAHDAFALDLALRPAKPPAIHGRDGVSRKGPGLGHTSHYYSLTRLNTSGTLVVGGDTLDVRGLSWMDHEFGSGALAPNQSGWDWFSIQLDDGRELMLYVLRLADGGVEPLSSGTLVERDGRTRPLALRDFSVRALSSWTSPASGGRYPSGWRVAAPALGLDLTLEPTVRDQELRTGAGHGIVYWEGSVRVRDAARGGRPVGRGYVELTGYAGPLPGL
jgi:predicted secreted hydrolase